MLLGTRKEGEIRMDYIKAIEAYKALDKEIKELNAFADDHHKKAAEYQQSAFKKSQEAQELLDQITKAIK